MVLIEFSEIFNVQATRGDMIFHCTRSCSESFI